MEIYSILEMLINNISPVEPLDDDLLNLLLFTDLPKRERIFITISFITPLFTKVYPKLGHYIFSYHHKKYPFEVLSDWDLQKYDLEILENKEERRKHSLLRTLKLACSKHIDLIDPHVVIGKSSLQAFSPIITFLDHNQQKVIDYNRNLVMAKDDYYQLFHFQEISNMDNYNLYCLWYVLERIQEPSLLYPLLLFPNETLKELSQFKEFEFLNKKFDSNGFNYRNYTLFGHHCDNMFFLDKDYDDTKYDSLREMIDEFTLTEQSPISVRNGLPVYQVQRTKFSCISDFFIPEAPEVETLHSNERYEHCHENSQRLAMILSANKKDVLYIVGGKISSNDKEYFYHSWVELLMDGKWYVLDFNHNLCMEKKKYYKIYRAVVISRTEASDMREAIQTVAFDAGLQTLQPMEFNFFGREFKDCLEKNQKMLSKKAL